MRIAVLHQAVPANAPADEQDVLEEVAAVSDALRALGHAPFALPVTLDLGAAVAALRAAKPDLVFNLCESLPGAGLGGKLASVPAALLEALGLRFTGNSAAALAVTADKLATKRQFRAAGIATPGWMPDGGAEPEGPLIVKSVDEHASIGLGADSVVCNADHARRIMAARAAALGGAWFAEQYIEGREFNLALLADGAGDVEVLPIAEQVFLESWPNDRPRILDYAGKWDPADPTYPLVERSFGTADAALAARLETLARACWHEFGLSGYARVDFRVAADGTPFVLEVNANPCLTPEMGIAAGAEAAGMDYAAMIARIVAAACAPAASAAPIARPPAPQKFRRETGPTDPDRVVALAEATKFFAGHEVAVARELAQAAADGDAHYRMLYADAPDGGLAGWACLGPTPCTEGAWDLYWVVVHPAAQGAGMGAALVAAASAIARAEGGRALYAETAGKPQYAPTRAFYARAGFRCQATLPDFYAPGDAKLVFARPLA
jgi:D-alanine-D-alanine ligase-like ATP-grasp enzyme/GNAT superfamily N-acetyltransferase